MAVRNIKKGQKQTLPSHWKTSSEKEVKQFLMLLKKKQWNNNQASIPITFVNRNTNNNGLGNVNVIGTHYKVFTFGTLD